MAFECGQTISEYEFIDVVERSKTGIAYKVRNTEAQRFELLKVLPRTLQDDQDRVERFLREIKVHGRLVHPNIEAFYNATQLAGQMVMTTELVEGVTLAGRLDLGPLPIAEAVNLATQALAALAYAHGQGIIHREVTPANMVITPEGFLKLSGFGLAKSVNDPSLTQMGAVMGSLYYMSPEQVKGLPNLDARSDIYSLGVVLYEMLTGRRPFEAASHFDIMLAHVKGDVTSPRKLNPALTPTLEQVVLKAMAKEAERRYGTAEEFASSLEYALAGKAPPAAMLEEAVQPMAAFEQAVAQRTPQEVVPVVNASHSVHVGASTPSSGFGSPQPGARPAARQSKPVRPVELIVAAVTLVVAFLSALAITSLGK